MNVRYKLEFCNLKKTLVLEVALVFHLSGRPGPHILGMNLH